MNVRHERLPQDPARNDRRGSRGSHGRRSLQIKALLSLGLLAGFGSVSTLAAWTGGATATSTIGAGTVAIEVLDANGAPLAQGKLELPVGDWYPGRSEAAMVTVRNTGTLAAPFAISRAITEESAGSLGAAMAVQVTNGSVIGTPGGASCDGDVLLTKAATKSLGDRQLQPAPAVDSEMALCVEYSLPLGAANALQGQSTTITLTFTATVGVV